jgi:hypothetical protein
MNPFVVLLTKRILFIILEKENYHFQILILVMQLFHQHEINK